MPSIPLHPRALRDPSHTPSYNPLPQLLQTPSGLAILEIQGTINIPSAEGEYENNGGSDDPSAAKGSGAVFETSIGKLMFPDYSLQIPADDTKWMKRVYLYVGRYQRMTGEVKKLAKPLAIIQRRQKPATGAGDTEAEGKGNGDVDELEIVEIVKHKIVFQSRPEPVGSD
ncbi:hypothetical protein VTN00DRAFT_10201 [Thermoascus crustaceus]|uniref:uncharacterized protein n=1 Tax=Thermoascus crustaceus TaxID=5088 RepID=UPI0037432658